LISGSCSGRGSELKFARQSGEDLRQRHSLRRKGNGSLKEESFMGGAKRGGEKGIRKKGMPYFLRSGLNI
jgi:hypothetical protein